MKCGTKFSSFVNYSSKYRHLLVQSQPYRHRKHLKILFVIHNKFIFLETKTNLFFITSVTAINYLYGDVMPPKKDKIPAKIKLKKHLNADALFKEVYLNFEKFPEFRSQNIEISIADALMSGFAMFSLKDPSLLAFDDRRHNDGKLMNLKSVYGIGKVPSDTTMREILDNVTLGNFNTSFKTIFSKIQRGGALSPMKYIQGHYILSIDGTGFFSSSKLKSDACLEKKNKETGETIGYYQQMLGASIVHPDFKEVIPLMPEMIIKQDGETKNDCERNACKRFFAQLRIDHPHLPLCITEDALSGNAPHIQSLKKYNFRFVLGVKPGDHAFLFEYVNSAAQKGQVVEFEVPDKKNPKITHRFRFLNDVPLNKSNQNVRVNFMEYWEITEKKTKHFSWITDFDIMRKNAYEIMRTGRVRWKIENETFNTLKNQGYHFGHNFGLGKKNLSGVFAMLMMLAFLVDQTQQLTCNLFQSVWRKSGSKRALWEQMRAFFMNHKLDSMTQLYRALLYGIEFQSPVILKDTS